MTATCFFSNVILNKRWPVKKFFSKGEKISMPKKKAVDTKALIKMVEAEETQNEIMKKFGFKTSTQLKTAYMNALIEAGKVTPIKGGRGVGKAGKSKQLCVGKRGSIIIPVDVVQELGINAEDKFSVRKTKVGIALKKL
jgi:hypothetical protein